MSSEDLLLAAEINARVAIANIHLQEMIAENEQRKANGERQAYSIHDFASVRHDLQHFLQSNNIKV